MSSPACERHPLLGLQHGQDIYFKINTNFFCFPHPFKKTRPRREAAFSSYSAYSLITLVALGPFGLSSVSKLTLSPSARLLKPSPLMDVWWTKASPPSSLAIKPNPLLSLNHLTVPWAISFISLLMI